ncbi:MAG: glycosyltransferase [Clostridia bacterium]|nr:glycosyltransferase [Clostridia bacterium]
MTTSVAIAAYNGARFIEEQLLSIMNQSLKVDEVIICDDGSTDGTPDICRAFIKANGLENWQVFENPVNKGYCLNFLGAIEKCTGDVIFIADQDDRWKSQKVEKMLSCLNENPDVSVLSCRYDVIDGEGKIIENSGIPYLGSVFDGSVEYLSVDSFIGCSYIRGFAMCFKKELKEYLKPIDLKSMLSHDWYICLLGALKGKTAVLNLKLTEYRYHFDNVSLSDMTRKTFLGDRQKRLKGLSESIEGHTYLKDFCTDIKDKKNFEKLIRLEQKRLKFLNNKNFFLWLSLIAYINVYKRYYKSLKGAFRVWIGDFCYGYNINFKK